jgi:hypothetical protein
VKKEFHLRISLARVLGTAAVTIASIAVLPTPAQAATSAWINTATVSPSSQVVNGDAGCGDKVKISVDIYDPAQEFGSNDITAEVSDAAGSSVDFVLFYLDSRSGDHFKAHGWVFSCAPIETPGKYHARITFEWYDDAFNAHESVRDRYFTIQRPTSLTYNASPEPVKVNTSLTHSGQLKFDPYSFGSMYGASGVTVQFWFKKSGTSTYVSKGSVTTGSGGKYSKKITATASGMWKAVYPGTSARQAQSMYDSVAVTG